MHENLRASFILLGTVFFLYDVIKLLLFQMGIS